LAAGALFAGCAFGQNFIARTSVGKQAGALVIETAADGNAVARYSWRDNGRGPDIVERYRLDVNGLPLRYQASGTTTMGSQIDELFERQGAPRAGARKLIRAKSLRLAACATRQ